MAALSRSPFRSPLYWVAFGAGLAWTVVMWIRAAPFASVLDDEIGHFLVARDSWVHPQLLLNAWGRVGTTIAFVLPAAAGLDVARGAALAMSAATFVLLVIVETVLFRFGLFGSGGNVDYLVSGRFGLSWKRLRAAGFGELASFGGGRVAVLRRRGGQGTDGGLRGMTISRPRCR